MTRSPPWERGHPALDEGKLPSFPLVCKRVRLALRTSEEPLV